MTACIYRSRHHTDRGGKDPLAATEALSRSEQGGTGPIMDDEPTVRLLVADVRQDFGYAVSEAADSMVGL